MNTRVLHCTLIASFWLGSLGVQAQSDYPKVVSDAQVPITSSDGFNHPQGLAVATDGTLFVADTANHRVLRITPTGTQSTVIFGSLSPAMNNPAGVALDGNGNLYVTESTSNRLIKLAAGAVNGSVIITGLKHPTAVAADAAGDLAVVNVGDNSITAMPSGGTPVMFNTGGTVLSAPSGVAFDANGNLYVTDGGDREHATAVYRFSSSGGTGTNLTPAGYDLRHLTGVTVDNQVNVYVLDSDAQLLIEIPANGNATFLIPQSNFKAPRSLAIDDIGNLYVTGAGSNANGVTKYVYSNSADFGSLPLGDISKLTFNYEFYETTMVQSIHGISGGEIGEFRHVGGTCALQTYSPTNGSVRIPESCTATIQFSPARVGGRPGSIELTTSTGRLSQPVYGIGQGAMLAVDPGVVYEKFPGQLKRPVAVTVNAADTRLYVADAGNQAVYTARVGSSTLTKVDTGVPTPALINIKVDGAGNLYVLNQSPAELIKVPADGTAPFVMPIPGLKTPTNFTIDLSSTLYVADANTGNFDGFILRVLPSGTVSKLSVISSVGNLPDLLFPTDIAADNAGNLWVAKFPEQLEYIAAGTWKVTKSFDFTMANVVGLATDTSNTLYYIDVGGASSIGIIPSGTNVPLTGSFQYPFSEDSLDSPTYLALSPGGDLYLIDDGKLKIADRSFGLPSFVHNFAGATLWNMGNQPLTVTGDNELFTQSGNGVGAFTIAPDSSGGCEAGTAMVAGSFCNLSLTFTPPGTGTFTDTLHFLTNAVNNKETVLKLTARH